MHNRQAVSVVHHEGGRPYWFRIPDTLSGVDFDIGDIVVCDTRRGPTYGKIVEIFKTADDDKLKNIEKCIISSPAKYQSMKLIKIPSSFRESTPSAKKFADKLENFYQNSKEIAHPLVVEQSSTEPYYTLVDGYISYLIAHMFDQKRVPVCVLEKDYDSSKYEENS